MAAEQRRGRGRAALSAVADRSVRHAVVHLSAADLLRRGEARAPRSGGADLGHRRRARDRAYRHRLDGDRRIRRPLRLFLHRLHLRAAGLRLHRAVRRRSRGWRSAASSLWGLFNGAMVHAGYAPLPFFSLALGLIGAAAVATIVGADGVARRVPPAALLRAQLDRHLSRLLPADGGDAHAAGQDRLDRRCRHHVGRSSPPPASSARSRCSGRCAAPGPKFLFERPARFWLAAKSAAQAADDAAAGGIDAASTGHASAD